MLTLTAGGWASANLRRSTILYMCPHVTVYVSSYYCICVLILLYMYPHTTVYVSSYYCICVLIVLCMCPHSTVYVSSQLRELAQVQAVVEYEALSY